MKPAPNLLIIAHGIDGGVAPLASALAGGLQGEGWNCTVRYIGRPATSKFVSIDQARGIDSLAVITGKARTFAEAWGLIRSILPIWLLVRETRPAAVIYAGFIPALLYPPFLRLFTSARFILWDHAPQNTFLKIKKLVFPLSLKLIDKVVSISRSTASAMKEYFGVPDSKITIIPNGIEQSRWVNLAPAPDFSVLRVIMPARLDLNQKDPVTLIKAAAKLHKQGVAVEVTLVGSGVDEETVRQVIANEGASGYVRLIAHSDDVPSLVAAHNILCLSTKFEGLPTVAIEGMLARRVVVASRVAGCVDVVRDGVNGFLFEAGSVDDCANKLQAIQRMTNINDIIVAAYQEALEIYTPQSMITNFQRVLAE